MSLQVRTATVWVRDQDEALEFFRKLDFNVSEDVRNGEYRWLAVASRTQPEVSIVLSKPGFPMDEATAEHIAEAVAKGMLSSIVFETDDCVATYEALQAKGIEFTRPAADRGYAIDASFRDPSGNEFRLLQSASRKHGA